MTRHLMPAAALAFTIALTTSFATAARAGGQAPTQSAQRFDERVRADFFAGVAGDAAALDRAMRLIEAALAENPKRPEALAWHGSGLLARAAVALENGDNTAAESLWRRGLEEMDEAVALAPGDVAVLIPRGATLLAVSRSVPDATRAKTLLATGVADYERVLALQAPYFRYLSEHARGELLFGLAEGLHRLGAHERSRSAFERLQAEAPGSVYGRMATAWLSDAPDASRRTAACVGCHHGK